MAPEPQSRRIPDVLLERFLANDLPAPEMARIQAAIAVDPALRQQLEHLDAHRRAFLLQNPAASFAHKLAVRLDVDRPTPKPTGRRWALAWVLGPSLVAAATFLVVATVTRNTTEPRMVAGVGQAPSPVAESPGVRSPSPQPASAPQSRPRATTPAGGPGDGRRRKYAEPPGKPASARLEGASRPETAVGDRDLSEDAPASRAGADKGRAKAGQKDESGSVAPAEPVPMMPAPAADLSAATEADERDKRPVSEGRKTARSAPAATVTGPANGQAKAVDEARYDDAEAAPGAMAARVKNEVVAGVNANAKSLVPCLTAARGRGDLVAGRQTLVLAWTIKPDGSVTAASLVGPGALLGKAELAKCVSRRMATWRFKTSNETIPVRNYPLPVVVP
jgi:hypothetical protein